MTDITTELVREPQAQALVPAANPQATLARQVETADALTQVIEDRKLYASVQNKKFLTVDAWLLLGSLVGVSTAVVETEQIENGYRAAVEARRVTDGLVVGRAEAICTRDERMWAKRDEYALLGMAQTRATSRALRGCLGAIVSLAGFQTVGAEEMPRETRVVEEKLTPARRVLQAANARHVPVEDLKRLVAQTQGVSVNDASLTKLTETMATQVIDLMDQ